RRGRGMRSGGGRRVAPSNGRAPCGRAGGSRDLLTAAGGDAGQMCGASPAHFMGGEDTGMRLVCGRLPDAVRVWEPSCAPLRGGEGGEEEDAKPGDGARGGSRGRAQSGSTAAPGARRRRTHGLSPWVLVCERAKGSGGTRSVRPG